MFLVLKEYNIMRFFLKVTKHFSFIEFMIGNIDVLKGVKILESGFYDFCFLFHKNSAYKHIIMLSSDIIRIPPFRVLQPSEHLA